MSAEMHILDAISDANVFGPAFRCPETWGAWRAFLASLFALPMSDEQLAYTANAQGGRSHRSSEPKRGGWCVDGDQASHSPLLWSPSTSPVSGIGSPF
jgi:hypothetical protein